MPFICVRSPSCWLFISDSGFVLSDCWLFISALSVGIGFALRDALSETLYGMQSGALCSTQFHLSAHLPETEEEADGKKKSQATYEVVQEEILALSCTVRNVDTPKLQYRVPWSYLHTRIVQYKPRD